MLHSVKISLHLLYRILKNKDTIFINSETKSGEQNKAWGGKVLHAKCTLKL